MAQKFNLWRVRHIWTVGRGLCAPPCPRHELCNGRAQSPRPDNKRWADFAKNFTYPKDRDSTKGGMLEEVYCCYCLVIVSGRLVDLPAPSIHVNSCFPTTGVRKVGSTACPLKISSPFRNQKISCVSPETEADNRIF